MSGSEQKQWEHRKTGGVYTEVARGKLQTSVPLADMAECVIYQGADGQFWIRPVGEFEDGRFAPYTVSP